MYEIPGGTHMQSLKKGDVVINAAQWQEIKKYGSTNTFAGKAYANGTLKDDFSKAYANGSLGKALMPAHADVNYKPSGSGGSITAMMAKQVGDTSSEVNGLTNSLANAATATKKANTGIKKFKEWIDKLFDFVEIRIQRIQDQIDLYGAQSANAFTRYTSVLNSPKEGKYKNYTHDEKIGANDYVNKQINMTKDLILTNANAADYYSSFAKSIEAKALKGGLKTASSIAQKIREGKLEVKELNENEKAFAQAYQTYYDKSKQALLQTQELQQTLSEFAQTKFDNITREFEAFNTIVTQSNDLINDYISLREKQGYVESERYYGKDWDRDSNEDPIGLIGNQMKNIYDLEQQRQALQDSLNESVRQNIIVYGSTAWRELQNDINALNNEIVKSNATLAEYRQKLIEISWTKFDSIIDEIDRVTNTADTMIDLLSFKDLVDGDTAEYTNEGIATLGLYSQQYEIASNKVDKYIKELKNLDEQYSDDEKEYNKHYLDRKKDLEENLQEQLKATKTYYQNMRDLSQQWVDSQVQNMNKMIDKYNQAKDSQKNLYDYANSVKEKTDAIANMRKQLAVASANNSEEGRLKTAKLQKQLRDAEKDLKESNQDKLLSDQKEMLNNLSEEYEQALNRQLKDFEDYYNSTIVPTINNSGDTIKETMEENVKTIAGTDNISLSDINENFSNTWSTYTEELKLSTDSTTNSIEKVSDMLTGTNEILGIIDNHISHMYDIANNKAESDADHGSETSAKGYDPYKQEDDVDKSNYTIGSKAELANVENLYDKDTDKEATNTAKKPTNGLTVTTSKAVQTYTAKDKKKKKQKLSKGKKAYIGAISGTMVHLYSKYDKKNKKGTGTNYGWISYKGNLKGYAKGTKLAKEDLAWTQENGSEIIRRSDGALLTPVKGSTIFNSEMTDRLWNFASDPNTFMEQIAKGMENAFSTNIPASNAVSNNIENHDNKFIFELQNVNDYKSFMEQAQKDKKFEQLIQNLTLGQLNGKSSLSKNRIKF